MSNSYITMEESDTGKKIRGILRTIGGEDVFMQAIVMYRGGIFNPLLLVAQDLGVAPITTMFTAKEDETQSTTATHYRVLSREKFDATTYGVDSTLEKNITTTTDNTTVINCARFFMPERFGEMLNLDGGTVKFQALVYLKSANASGTAYLQQIIFKLRKLTANDTYTDLATKTVTVNLSTTTTDYSIFALVVAYAPVIDDSTIDTDEQLVLEITTNGKGSSASYACYHKLDFTVGTEHTTVEIYTEEG
jgi:hypothetical protein